jgi:hypothetical protein
VLAAVALLRFGPQAVVVTYRVARSEVRSQTTKVMSTMHSGCTVVRVSCRIVRHGRRVRIGLVSTYHGRCRWLCERAKSVQTAPLHSRQTQTIKASAIKLVSNVGAMRGYIAGKFHRNRSSSFCAAVQ